MNIIKINNIRHRLKSDFITCNLIGRLGNIMFQVAHAYAKSIEYNRQFFISRHNNSIINHFEESLFKKINFLDIDLNNLNYETIQGDFEYHHHVPNTITGTMYDGFYQSEKFFNNYSNVIRNLFSIPDLFYDEVVKNYEFLNNEVVACINVRRGRDYLDQPTRHPVVSSSYIYAAYEELPPHDKIVVLSDDPHWCKENIKLPNLIHVTEYTYDKALWFLSLCDHFIISNSSFSWWGSWLSLNPDKKIIAPSVWFGPELLKEANPKDIYCHNWDIVNTRWVNGEIVV